MAKKVLVAMSGGVDSTYAAITLKEQGYDLVGVTFKINDSESTNTSINDAAFICKELGIKHIVLDYADAFKKYVFDFFIDSYKNGKTPNPCVICNKVIKFGLLNEVREKLDLDYIATGHYVQAVLKDGEYLIKKSVDLKKDQSYFLNQIPKEILPYVIFPLGTVSSKSEIREFLQLRNIKIAQKKDSQEICFVDTKKLSLFLDEYISTKMGNIISENGNVLGCHSGAFKYTIGQRKGLGISNKSPLYVLNVDTKKNLVYVGNEEKLYGNIVYIEDINIFSNELLQDFANLVGKVRYRSPLAGIKSIEFEENRAKVIFVEKQKSITPGQYLTIYNNEYLVLGGKII